MFVDTADITVKAGDGGNGAVSFHREKYVANGGPDGGDGGKGGNIVFLADDNLSTLADFRYKRKYLAENGENGKASNCYGKGGKDLVIRVPRGTLLREAGTRRLIMDISGSEPFIAAKGGRGGWGNSHFATPTRQCPRFAKEGAPGEEYELRLELKLLADVGLIGYPNVGKSTLISVVSQAKPKIANYHFTTLSPTLGVVRVGAEASFVMADIPGLIEGAGEGVGLGHRFLRHVERCRLLVHLVDVSGSEGRDPIEDFETVNAELAVYSAELASRPQILAANKCDLASDEQIERLRAFAKERGMAFFPMSAAIADGTKPLVNHLAAELAKLPPMPAYEPDPLPEIDEQALREQSRAFNLNVEDDLFIIEAPWLLKLMSRINPDDYESLQYFQRVLKLTGILDALKEAGIRQGDTVSIYDIEFDYIP
ncbi:MAG TPA: GTPase CgtA [Ruminococcaceae bacterium]|nr:GTPase CgtA [Oscillospiraceae bacterium]